MPNAPPVEVAYDRYVSEATPEHLESLWLELMEYSRAILRGQFGIYEDELATDAVVQVVLKLGTFAGRSKFLTWAYGVIRNYALDEIRRRKARHEVPLDAYKDVLMAPAFAQVDDTAWHQAIAGLDDGEVELLDRVVAGQSLGEVGECMEITREAAKKRWQRLRERLQTKLGAYQPQPSR